MAKECSIDLHSAEYAVEYALNAYRYRRNLYPFTFESNLDSAFNDTFENLVWYATSSKASVNLTKHNPFGNSISGGVGYEINRGIVDYTAESINSDAIGYSHNPSVSLSVSQSLTPAVANGSKRDSSYEILRKNIKTATYGKEATEKSLMESVAYYYIQGRCNQRDLDKYIKYIDLYDMKIDSAKELLSRSKISNSELWSYENKKWEYYQYYIETLNANDNIKMNLKNFCGETEEFLFDDSELPSYGTRIFVHNPEKEKLMTEIDVLELQNILNRQNYAPKLSFGGSISESTEVKKDFSVNYFDEKNNLSWTFSLGISFSEFFSPAKKLREQLYSNNLRIYNERLRFLDSQSLNQYRNYQIIINSYETQIKKVYELNKNKEELYKDYQQLFREGKCTRQDLAEVYLSVIESRCLYQNLEDNCWFYKWKKEQCR